MGLYCNVFEGPSKAGTCSGASYVHSHGFLSRASLPILSTTVRFHVGSDGKLTATVPLRQAIALHTGARGMGLPVLEPIKQVTILFYENATTRDGEVSWPFIDFGVELRRR